MLSPISPISPISSLFSLSPLFRMFSVREANIELLNDASSEYTLGVKLHFQIRIKAKDYPSVQALHNAAQVMIDHTNDYTIQIIFYILNILL